jgi:hypothetical protein
VICALDVFFDVCFNFCRSWSSGHKWYASGYFFQAESPGKRHVIHCHTLNLQSSQIKPSGLIGACACCLFQKFCYCGRTLSMYRVFIPSFPFVVSVRALPRGSTPFSLELVETVVGWRLKLFVSFLFLQCIKMDGDSSGVFRWSGSGTIVFWWARTCVF